MANIVTVYPNNYIVVTETNGSGALISTTVIVDPAKVADTIRELSMGLGKVPTPIKETA